MKGYRFFGTPDLIINDGETGKKMLQFDSNGEYVTIDPVIAERMRIHFKCKEIELVEKTEEVSEKEEVKIYKCKREGCTFETDNRGKFAAHSKTHKEG